MTYQKQLDEMARGLITDFQKPIRRSATPTEPAQAGLFTNGSSLTVPPAGVVIPGLASTIQVAAAVDPPTGNPELLRDGGISSNGAALYVYNPTPGQAGYTDRLTQDFITNMQQPLAFDAGAGAGTKPASRITPLHRHRGSARRSARHRRRRPATALLFRIRLPRRFLMRPASIGTAS